MRVLFCWLLLGMAIAGAQGQSFPFEESFTSYALGSTGAPAWTVLKDRWRVENGTLDGPVTARFNRRPPERFTAEITASVPGGTALEAGFHFNAPRDESTDSSDRVMLKAMSLPEPGLHVVSTSTGPSLPSTLKETVTFAGPAPDGPVRMRLVVDAEAGRYAVFVGEKAVVRGAAAEYAGGVLAMVAGKGTRINRFALRTPSDDEMAATRWGTLFNDPRDICPAPNGGLLVLHRSNPAITIVTPDGEMTRSFGRRLAGHIPDAVALEPGTNNQVYVLNRYPGEVVTYDRSGRIRSRFGAGRLSEPSSLAVGPDGTVFVADPGARRLVMFQPDGTFARDVTAPGGETGRPLRVSTDALGNILLGLDEPARTVVLRREVSGDIAVVARYDGMVSDAVTLNGGTLAARNAGVQTWPPADRVADRVFRAAAVGGLESDFRLAESGGAVYAMERVHPRVVVVPSNLRDVEPKVEFANIAQSAATIRWNSGVPAARSRARVLKGSTWDLVAQAQNSAVTEHQVLAERLLEPGGPIRFRLSPGLKTIPPTEWTIDYLFDPAANTVSPAPPLPVEPPAPPEKMLDTPATTTP